MKTIKEKQLLVKWSKAFNEEIDVSILREVQEYERIQEDLKHSLKDVPFLMSRPTVMEEAVTKQEPSIQTNEESVKNTDLVTRAVEQITKDSIREDSFQQPDPTMVGPDFNDMRKKIKFIEQFVTKIASHGPGGGAGDVINLDHPVNLINNDYIITRKDYYVGVNSTSSVTITMPESIGFPGRKIIIKDESGNCSSNPIVVSGVVDNDSGGFVLQSDNGAIQMIFREGWRII